jgi:hypothetical protein
VLQMRFVFSLTLWQGMSEAQLERIFGIKIRGILDQKDMEIPIRDQWRPTFLGKLLLERVGDDLPGAGCDGAGQVD